MDLSLNNIQRITEWIQSEIDYNFLNPDYTIAFNDNQILLEQINNELKQVCPHCLLVQRCLLNADTLHVFYGSKNIEDIDLCLKRYYIVQLSSNLAI